MPSSQEVVVRGAALPLTEAAYKKFDQGRIDLLQKTVGGTAPLPTFYAFLELSARYDLDPLTGQIWLAQMPGRNGAAGRYAILVGRDGYLAVADRDPGFIDVDADVVYSKDEFRVTRKADGTRTVEHAYGNPSTRGECLGAYAVLRREGKPDRYFYAPLDQYARNAEKSAWSYRDAMVIKCAVSYITRITYRVSGPVPADEVGLALDQADGNVIQAAGTDVPAAAALPQDVAELVARAAGVDPKSWRTNEVAARLPEPDDRGYDAAVKQITAELEAWLAENEPPDAEVVQPAGNEPVDVAAELQKRWDTDREWRASVAPLLDRYATLEAAVDEALSSGQDEQAQEMRAQLAVIAGDLDALGVPEGFWPENLAAGAQS
jgi:hypothetical protein